MGFYMRTILLMLIISTSLTIGAQSLWNGNVEAWTKGTGAENDPYQIETAAHLAYIAKCTNDGIDFVNTYFIQVNDIDLSGSELQASRQVWVPIGVDRYKSFRGCFDGNDKKIINMSINPNWGKGSKHAGLFGYTVMAIIKNVTIDGDSRVFARSEEESYGGGIVGRAEYSKIENCYSSATVYCYSYSDHTYIEPLYGCVGGIVGMADQTLIADCRSNGYVAPYDSSQTNDVGVGANYYSHVGGIVGRSLNGKIDSCSSNSCINAKILSGSTVYNSNVGGIAGMIENVDIVNCNNMGEISYDLTNRDFINPDNIGGIVGEFISSNVVECYNEGSINSTKSKMNLCVGGIGGAGYNNSYIKQCFNKGDIYIANCKTVKIGGIAGGVWGNRKTKHIINCYNIGDFKSLDCKNSVMGGIIGVYSIDNKTDLCCNNYSVGEMSCEKSIDPMLGNIIGRLENEYDGAFVSNCYSIDGILKVDDVIISSNLYGIIKTEEEMRSDGFVGMINNGQVPQVWFMDKETNINEGFPILDFERTFDVDEIENNMYVRVYPNPVKDVMTVDGKFTSIEMFDRSGRFVSTVSNNSDGIAKIDMSVIGHGIYFIKINDGNKCCVKKIIKIK